MDKNEIAGALKRLGIFNNVAEFTGIPLKKKKGFTSGFSFDDTINGQAVTIVAGFEESFPLSMPSYFILNYDNFEFIPHVERDGKVCYTHEDYVYLNAEDPEGIIKETYLLAKITIEKGLKKENSVDFANEYMAYWGRIDDCEEVFTNMILSSKPVGIKVGVNDGRKFAVSEEKGCIDTIHRFMDLKDKGITYYNSILIPFVAPADIIPPKYNQAVSIDYLKSLISTLDSKQKSALVKIGNGLRNSEQYVFFSFQQPNGSHSLFGVKFTNVTSSGFPLTSENFQGCITPIHAIRLDKDYLYKRGGNGNSASDKRGLIIGGGSLGGFITEELVRNGFFDLTVVDDGVLERDNSYRHVGGYNYIDLNKAEAIKTKAELYFPHANIMAIAESIEKVISKNKINFNDFDFVVVATGNVTINTYLNKIFTQDYSGLPVIYTWNDPYGIGGHCLVTNIEGAGCYQCLYSNDDLNNVASFAHKDQPKSFLKSISGCGSTYTPYGSIDSIQTCCLTVKKVIDIVNGNEKNSVYSWKGSASVFLQEGFKLSARYHMSTEELEDRKHAFNNINCKNCQHK